MSGSQFWDDLADDLRNPEFRAAYLAESARLQRAATGCALCGGYGMRHDPIAHGAEPTEDRPGPCRNCDCPWDSCLIHNEFCCDACSHPDGPR